VNKMNDFDLDAFLPYQLAVLSSRVSDGFMALYKEKFGISNPEWRVVAHLSQAGSVSVREIFRKVDMDKSKVSRAATRLENAGYITKKSNSKDRRLVELALTDKGRSMVAELAPIARAYEEEVLAALGPHASCFRAAVNRLLAKD